MTPLSPRLNVAASLVSGDVLIDVGTDHGFLPCYLVGGGACKKAYACDIAEGPLSSAKAAIARERLDGKVVPVLSDGLLGLDKSAAEEATDIVIAGMGGELIAEIIAKGADAGKLNRSARLILQPNTKVPFLRVFLAENGYRILSETAVRDGRFIYTVICAEFSGDVTAPDKLSAAVGRLDPRDETAREYLEKETEKLRTAAKGMAASSADAPQKQAEKLISLADGIQSYIETETSK